MGSGGLDCGTSIKLKPGLQPKSDGIRYANWLGGDFIKDDEPQGSQGRGLKPEGIPEVSEAMRACVKRSLDEGRHQERFRDADRAAAVNASDSKAYIALMDSDNMKNYDGVTGRADMSAEEECARSSDGGRHQERTRDADCDAKVTTTICDVTWQN